MSKIDFISETDFEAAIRHVVSAIDSAKEFEESINQQLVAGGDIFKSSLFSNSVDPFLMKFGMSLLSREEWLITEVNRQLNKTFEQRIGEFHQKVLGSVDGWVDLGIGDDSKVDLFNKEKNIYMELKNKFNTTNGDSLDKVHDKLLAVLEQDAKATAFYGFIVPDSVKKQGSSLWVKGRKKIGHKKGDKLEKIENSRLYRIWGADVYRLVTGDAQNLHKTYEAIAPTIESMKLGQDSLSGIGKRICDSLVEHIDDIEERIFYSTVADSVEK